MSHTLTYGDIIRIYCSLQDNREGNKTGGFLMSKGFADTNIYFLKSKEFTEFELRNSLFEVLPYSSFEIHDEAKKKKEQAKTTGKKLDLTENTKSSMKTQQEQFKSKIMKQKKMQINFDSQVVIKHVNSDGYLQGEFSCPQTGIGSFKLILSSELSSDVKFKITRFRNSDKQAQKIQSKDQFILYHCTSHCYLNIGDLGEKVFLDKQIRIQFNQQPPLDPMQIAKQDKQAHKIINQRPLIKQPNESCNKSIQRHEVVNMSKPTLILNFLLEKSSRDQQIESQIRHNDVIFIKNTQNQSYLTADLWSGQVSLVSYTGAKTGNFPYQGIWEVSVPRDTEKGQVSNIKNYFLKHYVTDKIVSVINSGSHLKRLKLHDKMTFNAPIKTVKVVNYKQTKILNHRDLVFLKVCQSDTQAVLHTAEKIIDENTSHEFLDIGHKTQKIFRTKLQQKIDEDSTNYNMEITKGPLVNAFQIFKLQQNKLKQVNKILSCVQILTNFCDVLIVLDNLIRKKIVNNTSFCRQTNVSHQSENHNNTIYSDFDIQRSLRNDNRRTSVQDAVQPTYEGKIEKFLNQYLNYYILNLVIQTIEYLFTNIKKPSKKPDFPLMMMIKSLGLIQILVQAIFFIERNQELIKRGDTSPISEYLKKKKYLRDRLQDCFKKIYQLLFELSQQNSCRLYLGKWFGMFMNQFYSLRSDYIHVLIIALLKQKLIMKSLIDSDIQKCIQNMTAKQIMNSNKSYKYLELLSSFCRAKNTVVPKNQKFIMKKLKEYPDLFYKFSTHDASKSIDETEYLYAQKNQLYYKKKDEQGLLQNFQDDDKWSYIIFLLNLYADLIFDHSYQKMKEFRQFISMNTVKAFFIKKDITEKNDSAISIVDSFLKLTHYFFLNELNESISPTLYVDREQTIYIVNNIQSQNQIQVSNNIDVTNDILKQYQDVVTYIMQQILSRKKFKEQKQYKVSKLKTMQTSLDFIKAISRLQDNNMMTNALKLIIEVVIQLKRSVVFTNSEKVVEQLMTLKTERSEGMLEQEFVSKQKNEKDEAVKKVDDSIDKNIKKLLFEKPLQRLLIDTRSSAGEILDIRLNLLINKALSELNEFFTDVCQNKAHIEHYNRDRNSDIFVAGESSHWIWINKIVQIVDFTINQNIDNLVFNNKKTTLVKLLIECIFVSSLKITNKIMMLIFRMYQLRKTLMIRFKDTFIVVQPCFKQICQFNMRWVSDFQKIKIGGNYNNLMTDLQVISMMIRFYDDEQKSSSIKVLLNSKNKKIDYQSKKKQILDKLKIGMTNYLVFNETETCLSTNQILLQKMIGNQKIHSHVLSYIKTLSPGVKNYDQHVDIAYEFLTLLVYNNRKNKKVLTKQIKVALSHITTNYRAIQFIKKTVIENQNIINNKQLVAQLVQAILQGAHSVDGDKQKIIIKAKLMQSLRMFCIFEGKNHTENQSYIMIQLQNKKYDKSLMFSTSEYKRNKNLGDEGMFIIQQLYNIGRQDHLLKAIGADNGALDSSYEEASQQGDLNADDFKKYPKILNDFIIYRKRFGKLIEKKTGTNNLEESMGINIPDEEVYQFQVEGDEKAFKIDIPGNLLYLAAYFSTMSALVQGGHQINKGKCCNIHPFESLLQFIQDATKCYPLLRHLRAYFIKLYFYNFMQKKPSEKGNTARTKQYSLTLANPKLSSIQSGNVAGRQNLKDFEYLMNRLFGKQINLIIDRLKCINIQLLDQYNQDYKIIITTPIRYKFMQSYMLGLLQQILYQVNVFFEKVNEFISVQNEEIIRKHKKISKQESHSLREIIKHLGTTYQLVIKLQKDSTVKKLIKNIFRRSMNIVKIIDVGSDQLDFGDIEKKVDEKTKQGEDFKELSQELSKKKERLYKFMLYYFFLSYQDEKGITLVNTQAIKHEDHHNVSVSAQDNLKKSFIRRLIPSKMIKKSSIKKDREQSQKLVKQLQNHTQIQTRMNKLLEIVTEDLVQRQEASQIIKEQLDQLVKLCCDLDEIQQNNDINQSEIYNEPDLNLTQNRENKQFRIIGYNKFMTDIITLVTKSPAHLTLEGKIKTIRLIRLIFQRKVNMLCRIENKQWQSGFFQQQKLKMLKQIQYQFKKIDLDKMIVAILKQENISYRLLLQTFKLGIKFLYNGNSECQAAILNNLKQDSENKVMVSLFNFIKKMRWEISQGKFVLKKQESEQNLDKFKPFIIDTFHYFDRNNKCLDQLGAEKDNSKEFEEQIQQKIKCVCKAYQFLQLLCQNDNQIAKNFLRLQTNQNGYPKYNSINFVSETSKLFKVVLQNYDPKESLNSILQYLADFFIEVTQLPCTQNQLELCSTSIFSDIRYYAINSSKLDKQTSSVPGKPQKSGNSNKSNIKFDQPQGPQKPMCYLMDFVVNAGLSLLQGSSNEIYKALILFFDKQFVYEIFRYQRQVLVVLNKKNPQCPLIHQFNDDTLKILLNQNPQNALIKKRIYMIYNLFALVQKLSKYSKQHKSRLNNESGPLIDKLTKYAQQQDQKQKQKQTDTSITYEPSSKTIIDFCKKLKHIQVVFQQKKQYIYFPDLPIFKKLSNQTKQNILEDIKRESQVDKITDFIMKSPEINNLMNWNYKVEDRLSLETGTLQRIRFNILSFTLVIVALYIIFTTITFVEIKGKTYMLKTIENPFINSIVNTLCVLHLFSSIYFVYTWCTLKYRMPIEKQLKQKGDAQIAKLLQKIDTDAIFNYKDYWTCLKLIFKHEQAQAIPILIFFIIFSFLGYFFGIEWYSVLIFDMVTRNKILKNVIQAITSNLQQLLVVSLLILAFVYFSLYLPLIYQQQDQKCTVLSDCVISLYTSGEIGQKHKDFKFTKFFADLLYVVIMQLLFSNIVSGIVIDTFAQLRDQRKTIQTDTETTCFICGISKGILQKQLRQQQQFSVQNYSGTKRFQKHIQQVHSQWDYIYYLYILSQKDITTYSGIQYFIKKQTNNDQYDWIPRYQQDQDKQIKEILEVTQRLVPKIKQKIHNRNELTN